MGIFDAIRVMKACKQALHFRDIVRSYVRTARERRRETEGLCSLRTQTYCRSSLLSTRKVREATP